MTFPNGQYRIAIADGVSEDVRDALIEVAAVLQIPVEYQKFYSAREIRELAARSAACARRSEEETELYCRAWLNLYRGVVDDESGRNSSNHCTGGVRLEQAAS